MDKRIANRPAGRVTLHDVAAAAGVSKSTVSRVLDERLPPSDNATARRVREVAEDLGYMRDNAAATLRRGSTMTVGVIVPRLTDTVMAMLYEEIAKACIKAGRFAIVATTEDRVGADRDAAESLIRRGVDGLILATAREDDDFPEQLVSRGVPTVLALRSRKNCAAAIGDDRLGGFLAARHLLDLGHERFGIIAGPPYASSSVARVESFRETLAAAGIPHANIFERKSDFGIDSGADVAAIIMGERKRPTALFAVNDNTAIGALSVLLGQGLRVPAEVSLVGYNDIPIVSRLPIPLTTLRVPFDQVATNALNLLSSNDKRSEAPTLVSAPTLIPRQSTGRAPLQFH